MKEKESLKVQVAVINDTHFGARQDSEIFLDHQEKFYREIFFKTLKDRNIDTILHLGDLFDRRKSINFLTLHRTKQMFLNPLKEMVIRVHLVAGNHDTFFKTTNEINSLELLLKEYENIHVYWNSPVKLNIGSSSFLLCPWIAKDNKEIVMHEISNTDATILAGHFEFCGFEMTKGRLSDHGLDPSDFSKFDMIWSGHFHIPSKKQNVRYLGAPYEMDWGDHDGLRGFHIFDTETQQLERIANPFVIHHVINYDDVGMTLEDLESLDFDSFHGTFIRLNVKNRTNTNLFDMLVKRIESIGAADLKIVEDPILFDISETLDIESNAKDTREIMHDYIDGVETRVEKLKIKNMIDDLYREAQSLSL
jgi:DNA repair exonuclease SbcCD nuclease subunit